MVREGRVAMGARWAAMVVGLAASMVLSGCGAKPSEVEVTAREVSYGPSEVRVERGKPVALHLRNAGAVLHDWTMDRLPARDVRVESGVTHGVHDAKVALHVAAEHGATSTVTFTPTEAGTYDVYCTEPGHREAGMTARVVVQ
mgnify:FL=1